MSFILNFTKTNKAFQKRFLGVGGFSCDFFGRLLFRRFFKLYFGNRFLEIHRPLIFFNISREFFGIAWKVLGFLRLLFRGISSFISEIVFFGRIFSEHPGFFKFYFRNLFSKISWRFFGDFFREVLFRRFLTALFQNLLFQQFFQTNIELF